ncbi:MAG: hypothetical protein J6W05_09335 [Prevotella sp.]|nr:hypothetical protein [Prevotella sp.]
MGEEIPTSGKHASDSGQNIPPSGNYPLNPEQEIPTPENLLPDFRQGFTQVDRNAVYLALRFFFQKFGTYK